MFFCLRVTIFHQYLFSAGRDLRSTYIAEVVILRTILTPFAPDLDFVVGVVKLRKILTPIAPDFDFIVGVVKLRKISTPFAPDFDFIVGAVKLGTSMVLTYLYG